MQRYRKNASVRYRVEVVASAATIIFSFSTGSLALAATRDPVFSISSGTTFTSPRQIALSVPFNGETRYTTDGTTPTSSSPLYNSPILIKWTQSVKAISIVNSVSSNVVTATFTLDAAKYPAPAAGGTTAPIINIQQPTPAQ